MNDMKDLFGFEITDDDIRWLLMCTDAVHNFLRSLKLMLGRSWYRVATSCRIDSVGECRFEFSR